VVVADDHKLTFSGVADSLAARGIDVVGLGRSAPAAVAVVEQYSPDVLVTDLDFGPGPTGLDVAGFLRTKFPLLGIVFLSSYADPRFHSISLESAPCGLVYLIKQSIDGPTAIVDAVHASVDEAPQAVDGDLPRVDLTPAQLAVLRLVAGGLSNQAIAQHLSVTEESVSKTVNRILKRLGISSGPCVNSRAVLIQHYFDLIGAN
jgi:two-component system, NarL family, nitrate/nitrite response regulator NarL